MAVVAFHNEMRACCYATKSSTINNPFYLYFLFIFIFFVCLRKRRGKQFLLQISKFLCWILFQFVCINISSAAKLECRKAEKDELLLLPLLLLHIHRFVAISISIFFIYLHVKEKKNKNRRVIDSFFLGFFLEGGGR